MTLMEVPMAHTTEILAIAAVTLFMLCVALPTKTTPHCEASTTLAPAAVLAIAPH